MPAALRYLRSVLALLPLVAVAACGSYQVVSTTPSGGEVMLDSPGEDAREKAEAYMGERCKFGYEILDANTKHPSVERASRIAYKCKEVPAPHPQAERKEVAMRF